MEHSGDDSDSYHELRGLGFLEGPPPPICQILKVLHDRQPGKFEDKLSAGAKTGLELLKAHADDCRRVCAQEGNPDSCGENTDIYEAALKKGVRFTDPGHLRRLDARSYGGSRDSGSVVSWMPITREDPGLFPPSKGLAVNMLPFIMGDKESLPEDLKPYYKLIELCCVEKTQDGKVCYLTVQESYVTAGQAQRRPGLHIEAPPLPNPAGATGEDGTPFGYLLAHWGACRCTCYGGCETESGECECPLDRPRGGIYMASNVADSTSVYDAQICLTQYPLPTSQSYDFPPGVADNDQKYEPGTVVTNVNAHGDIENLCGVLDGRQTVLLKNAIYWMTDRTPHESLPVTAGTHRQYFRLVTSKINVWYSEHSTANPKVPLPEGVTVIAGNKFDAANAKKFVDGLTNDIAAAKPRAAGIAALEEAKKALKVSQAVVADLEAQLEAVRKAAVRGTPSTC